MTEEEEWKSQHDKSKLDKKDVRVDDVLVATCGDDGDARIWRPLQVFHHDIHIIHVCSNTSLRFWFLNY